MEKQKKWQLYCILAVIFLTIYNVLPTVFYYTKPLKKPIGEKEGFGVARAIVERVNSLEPFTLAWLKSQSSNLRLKPVEITLESEDPRLATITFKNSNDAAFFAQTLNRAGALIPFIPAQLVPDSRSFEEGAKTVVVQRKIGVHLNPKNLKDYFRFIPKELKNGEISREYQELTYDRMLQLALGFGGTSRPGHVLVSTSKHESTNEEVIHLARMIVEYENAFGDQNPITKRYYASFTQVPDHDSSDLVQTFTSKLESLAKNLGKNISSLKEERTKLQTEGKFQTAAAQQQLELYESQKNILESASSIVKRNTALFQAGETPLTSEDILKVLNSGPVGIEKIQKIDLGLRNPFVAALEIDWSKDQILITLHPDVAQMRGQTARKELDALQLEKLNQYLFNEIAMVARSSDESITPSLTNFVVTLHKLTNSSSLLVLDLGAIGAEQSSTIARVLSHNWQPKDKDLSHQIYPIYSWEDFEKLPPQEQKFGFVIYIPSMEKKTEDGFRNSSFYVVARGLNAIRQKYQELADSSEKSAFEKDFKSLQELMRQNGFIGYSGASSGLPNKFHNDYIFELDDYYSFLLAATRENFVVTGSKKQAFLEFTDVEQRILTLNKIESEIHEDLLRWRDEYRAAKVSVNPTTSFDIPKPTQNVLWNNFKLSFRKYFRGDDRKILKWGLDLSGGKTVRIGLRDQDNQVITDEVDLKQASNELYQRVNRLGVSEVGIRTEGSTIVLDFPGSQGLSAADLIQASAMYFHVVNEKFSPHNTILAEAVNTFLEDVWNEAVITNRTDPESLNDIAWVHLGGNPENPAEFHPLSNHAQLLYDHGLRLTGPKTTPRSSSFDDTLSAIVQLRGSDFSDWQGQTHPLLIIFRNYALEGADLTEVQTGYDPSEGNILYFGVRGSYVNRLGEKIQPRENFYAWTSRFSEEKIVHTPLEAFSQGRGWRMAVVLNGTVISSPTLNSPLRDSARISGHFSQREINQLAADLKAGSLSFTPHILSEENVSPDLGKEQRTQGILAAIFGLLLVILAMCIYYRFGGVVASIAVLFNLLIIWGVLQNLGAALTLPSIAGIILALGMAVDANVLVFERIREEFERSKRLPTAIQAGYRKAFTAIVDSNLTTILAAVVLLNFDSGPIKGLALTLIIGIVSSMFSALFMTRFFFAGWVQNPKHKELKMMRLFKETHINFISKAKLAITISAAIIVIGAFFLVKEHKTVFGMDFTGGYALTLELQEQQPHINYRLEAENALVKGGAARSDFHIQELNKPNRLRIQIGMSMEQPGKPFYNVDAKKAVNASLFPYQENARIVWIVDTLESEGLQLTPASLPQLNLNWTAMSGQLSDAMRNEALIGLGIALIGILIYITFRFEFKYAISATVGLIHDLCITIGILAICHFFFEGMRIDLQVIAALMTIVGYSLNDTIIIFDRIREDLRQMRKMSFADIINHALNATLSRTVMTSGTTLLVLIALVIFGGSSIFNFAFIMTIGIAIGTLSSLYVAAPMLLYFHKREATKEQESASPKSV